jgi:E3 ubiquitin-protein ligase UHRF1
MAQPISAYEQQRLDNIAANNAVLASLGLGGSGAVLLPTGKRYNAKKPIAKKKVAPPPATKKREASEPISPGRKSPRLSRSTSTAADFIDAEDVPLLSRQIPAHTDRVEKPSDIFGEIPGFPVGSAWDMRAECCADLVHRATVAGIVGLPTEGCYSIVLNGGYADDVDHGDLLTYTGSGGRSLKGTASNPKNLRTGPATHDQTLDGKEGRYNAALHKSCETGKPVRVVRGYKLDSQWAPLGLEFGGQHNYRYDGLCAHACSLVSRPWTSLPPPTCPPLASPSYADASPPGVVTYCRQGREGLVGCGVGGVQSLEVCAEAPSWPAGTSGRGGAGGGERGRGWDKQRRLGCRVSKTQPAACMLAPASII